MPATYRADQVGSLLRPPAVLEAQAAYAAGRLPLDELREIEDRAILMALDLQRAIGLDVFSDGEYRRPGWARDFEEAVEGYVPGSPPTPLVWHGAAAATTEPQAITRTMSVFWIVAERLRQKRRLTAHEAGFLKQHAPGPFKMTLPAASYLVARGYKPGVTEAAYPHRADLLADVARIIRGEIQALVDEGVPYIQVDNPHFPDYFGEARRQHWQAIGIDPDQALAEDIAADNACLEGFDRSRVTLAVHVCRGNGRSSWLSEGSYEPVAEQVFGRLNYDRFLLEYDTERAGGFEPLRFVPRGKQVVLGLVTTKVGSLERKQDLLERIQAAARFVPLEDLAVSPQCGFASVAEGNLLSWDEQRRKLELVVELARDIWG